MAKKQATPSIAPVSIPDTSISRPSASATPRSSPTKSANRTKASGPGGPGSGGGVSGPIRNAHDVRTIVQGIWDKYVVETPQRTKLLDCFLAFLIAVGALQFVYCVVAGNFPFNAFLSGFGATVGQFVLTVSLRMQTSPDNTVEFKHISHERYEKQHVCLLHHRNARLIVIRAFADYILGSVILHFFVCNYIN